MLSSPHLLDLPTADSTARLGAALASQVMPGDCLLLSGDVGAGKTHLARALIQSIQTAPEDVPSPTFTLVQTYDTTCGALWHVDLYRISTDSEVDELGLIEAFDTAICLVEWPDRLGSLAPKDALGIDITPSGDGRHATLTWTDPKWDMRLNEVLSNA